MAENVDEIDRELQPVAEMLEQLVERYPESDWLRDLQRDFARRREARPTDCRECGAPIDPIWSAWPWCSGCLFTLPNWTLLSEGAFRRKKGREVEIGAIDPIMLRPGTLGQMVGGKLPVGPERWWLACDGSAVSIPEYVELFDALGFEYGTAPAGSFRLPELRNAAGEPGFAVFTGR